MPKGRSRVRSQAEKGYRRESAVRVVRGISGFDEKPTEVEGWGAVDDKGGEGEQDFVIDGCEMLADVEPEGEVGSAALAARVGLVDEAGFEDSFEDLS